MNYLDAKAYEVLEARPIRYKNQDTRQNNPIQSIVTTYDATPEARPTGNGRASGNSIDQRIGSPFFLLFW